MDVRIFYVIKIKMTLNDLAKSFLAAAEALEALRIGIDGWDERELDAGYVRELVALTEKARDLITRTSKLGIELNRADLHWKTRERVAGMLDEISRLDTQLVLVEQALSVTLPEPSPRVTIPKSFTPVVSAFKELSTAVLSSAIYEQRRFGRYYLEWPRAESLRGRAAPWDLGAYLELRSATLDQLAQQGLIRAITGLELFTIVPVLFGTNRDRNPNSEGGRVEYLDGRAEVNEGLRLGVAEVSIPFSHRKGRLERPTWWKFEFREDPSRHIVIQEIVEDGEAEWISRGKRLIERGGRNEVLIFIHGFNVGFEDAIRRAAQLGRDRDFKGITTAFSWSSENKLTGYPADADNARNSVPDFIRFMGLLRTKVGVDAIHIIAHSMGNLVLTEALKSITASGESNVGLKQVVLAAPDVDARSFEILFPSILRSGKRYTLYGSDCDDALIASKKIRMDYERAGDGGTKLTVLNGLDSIDASPVGADLLGLGHSYFAEKRPVLDDLYYLINEDLPPTRRAGLKALTRGSLPYWEIEP